ncbi:MAG: hypothetical protein WCV41_00760, partial [Patescibacteria group bacterium]
MKKIFSFIVIVSSLAILAIQLQYAQAENPTDPLSGGTKTSTITGGSVSLTNHLTNNTSNIEIPTLIGRVINGVLGIVGSLALLMFIYGGLLWMTSAGSDEKVKRGKDI